MTLQALKDSLATLSVATHVGYPPTGARLPYVVLRPMLVDPSTNSLAGVAIDWDSQVAAYCAAASPEASGNLAISVMRALHGARVAGYVLSTSMGYMGAQVEGHYESQVTIQCNQGAI